VSEPVIICVDDDADVARVVARSLKREHLQLMSTTEPQEALEWIVDNEVAVLVSDYEMPVMNGIELASRVRELSPTTVRVLLTGHLDIETALASINEGEIYRFIPKPLHVDALVSVVHQAIAYHHELAAVATARHRAIERARAEAKLEAKFPTITTPARAHDGAYLLVRRSESQLAGLGLDALLALRH